MIHSQLTFVEFILRQKKVNVRFILTYNNKSGSIDSEIN